MGGGAGGGTASIGGGQGGGTANTGGGQGNVGGGTQGGGGGHAGGGSGGGQGSADGGARAFNIEFKQTCPAITPCGGDPVGKWAYTGACFSLSFDAGCPGVTYDFHGTASGTMEFTPSSVSQSVSWAVGGTVVVPYTCSLGLCGAVTTAVKKLGLQTTGCTSTGQSGPCTCPVSFDGGSVAASDAGASGTTFRLSDSSGATSTYEYCIQNGSLGFHQVATTSSTDSSVFTLRP